eukprot:313396_1
MSHSWDTQTIAFQTISVNITFNQIETQSWTQIHDTLYFIDFDGYSSNLFKLNLSVISNNYTLTPLYVSHRYHYWGDQCLCNNGTHLLTSHDLTIWIYEIGSDRSISTN